LPIWLRIGSTALKSSGSPPTINVNVPFWAPVIPIIFQNQLKQTVDNIHNTNHPRRVHQQNVIVYFEPFPPFVSMFVHQLYYNRQ
jgi:hypothetical protein